MSDAQVKRIKANELTPDIRNANRGTERGRYALETSLREYGAGRSILVDKHGRIVAGNKTLETAAEMGLDDVIVVQTDGKQIVAVQRMDLDLAQDNKARMLAYADNRVGQLDLDFDPEVIAEDLAAGLSLDLFWQEFELDEILEALQPEPTPGEDTEPAAQTLAEKFIVPPFTVLDARQGYWQERKRAWIQLGVQGELGRDADLVYGGKGEPKDDVTKKIKATASSTSVFDPVLCEVAYRWFCPPGGHIINPTAGESVYGLVAGRLGYTYEGVEIRRDQVEENKRQAASMGVSAAAQWIYGDGRNTVDLVKPADFIMCCPPYFDLEVYSDLPQDISTAPDYDEFIDAYQDIVKSAVAALKDDRFACFVVGDVRGKNGSYLNFIGDTILAFAAAGCGLYNEAIFLSPIGSVPLMASRNFSVSRKLGKLHQNVLIFIKGDWRKAVAACGNVEVVIPDEFG